MKIVILHHSSASTNPLINRAEIGDSVFSGRQVINVHAESSGTEMESHLAKSDLIY
jgi:hypothetical protein